MLVVRQGSSGETSTWGPASSIVGAWKTSCLPYSHVKAMFMRHVVKFGGLSTRHAQRKAIRIQWRPLSTAGHAPVVDRKEVLDFDCHMVLKQR